MRKLIIILSLLIANVTHAGREGGAGDSIEIEFKSIGRRIGDRLNDELSGHYRMIDANVFANIVNETQVYSTSQQLFVDGKQKEARNFPDRKEIEIHRASWIKMKPLAKALIVFHEYLGILGLDKNYELSSDLTSAMSEQKILKMVADSAPAMEFKCKLIRLNPNNATTNEVCGPSFLLTTKSVEYQDNPFRPNNSYFSHECGDIAVSLDQGFFGTNFDVQLSQLEPGKPENWRHRQNRQYSTFRASVYSTPEAFALGLTIDYGIQLLGRKAKTFELLCEQNSLN